MSAVNGSCAKYELLVAVAPRVVGSFAPARQFEISAFH